jgi:hypothetical protein
VNGEGEPTPTVALLDGRYQLHERVGEGGMAEVYRAEDTLLGRIVAIKLMRTDTTLLATDSRARGEVTALATLNHPSLVTLLDARVEHGQSRYLVMEYVDGPTLAERMNAGALPGDEVVHLAAELAAGLHAVHEAGLVHRDVKPSNVLLAPGAGVVGGFQVKLADFGLAEPRDTDHATTRGLVLGTAAYLAPEQVRGLGSRPASDVYAFGLVLLEALTGERAFAHTTGIGAVLARLTESPVIPDGLGPGWTELLTAMTAHDPDLRPTALEVACRVASLQVPHPAPLVPSRPAGSHVAPRRQMGRHVAAPRRLRALTGPGSRWPRRAVVVAAIAAACLIVIQASVLAWGRSPGAGFDLETLQEADVTSTSDIADSSAARAGVGEPGVGTADRQRASAPEVAPVAPVAAEPRNAAHTVQDAKHSAAEERDVRKAASAEERRARKQAAADEREADKQVREANKEAAAHQRDAEKRARATTGG